MMVNCKLIDIDFRVLGSIPGRENGERTPREKIQVQICPAQVYLISRIVLKLIMIEIKIEFF